MIVLNTQKELVRVESWTDITGRPGFTDNLDPSKHKPSAIIGQYAFSDYIRCGLSNCHTQHARGYLVVTKEGLETNIGKDCGKTYFGVEFEAMANQFNRDVREKMHRERLGSFAFGLDELKGRLQRLRSGDRGADWVYSNSRALKETAKGVPGAVVRQINEMIKTGRTVLTIERPATERETEQADAAAGRRVPRPHIVSEPVAEIRGLSALLPENDLRELLVINLDENIKKFEQVNIDASTYDELGRWAKWVSSVEGTLERATEATATGRALLTATNLEPFSKIIRDSDDIKAFRKYLRAIG